jgi:hypothetical protein
MAFAFRPKYLWLLILVAALTSPGPLWAEAVVWSGFDFTFSKPSGGSPSNPANQDRITDQVILTRDSLRGIYNIAQESSYSNSSPADTRWAFPANNPGKTIAAANWADLTFAAWRAAHNDNPPGTLGRNAVVHLVSDDIYLDIRFLAWGQRGSGEFSYIRAIPPEPFSCGDLDKDRDVDSGDLLSFLGNWTGEAPGSGSTFDQGDCDSDGDVDTGDLLNFLSNWTGSLSSSQTLPATASQQSAAVPEPGTVGHVVLLVGSLLLLNRRHASTGRRSLTKHAMQPT